MQGIGVGDTVSIVVGVLIDVVFIVEVGIGIGVGVGVGIGVGVGVDVWQGQNVICLSSIDSLKEKTTVVLWKEGGSLWFDVNIIHSVVTFISKLN